MDIPLFLFRKARTLRALLHTLDTFGLPPPPTWAAYASE
jgi:hypothetical protein